MFCEKCGMQIDDGGHFCDYCGAKLEERTPDISILNPEVKGKTDNPYKGRRTNKKWFILSACALLVAICAIFFFNSSQYKINKAISAFKSSDTSTQDDAVEKMSEMGERAADKMLKGLEDENAGVRACSARVLGNIKDYRALIPLINLMSDANEDEEVKIFAAYALGELGDDAAVDTLTAALSDDNVYICNNASDALVKIGSPSIYPVIEALKGENMQAREKAVSILERIGSEAVEPLIENIYYEDIDVQLNIIKALGNLKDSRAIEPLFEMVNHQDADISMTAEDSLVAIGEDAVMPLIEHLRDSEIESCYRATDILSRIGAPAVEPLIAALKDVDYIVRQLAAEALVNTEAQEALDKLMAALENEQIDIIAAAYPFFIKKGEPGSEHLLVRAIDEYGTKEMGVDYLNCGNEILIDAAEAWGERNGYTVVTTGESHDGPQWGEDW